MCIEFTTQGFASTSVWRIADDNTMRSRIISILFGVSLFCLASCFYLVFGAAVGLMGFGKPINPAHVLPQYGVHESLLPIMPILSHVFDVKSYFK
jgi:hypothetical protein